MENIAFDLAIAQCEPPLRGTMLESLTVVEGVHVEVYHTCE